MATKKPATRQPTLDDLIAGGYRYTTVEDAPQEPEQAQPEKSSLARRALGDTGVALVKGAIGVPEALVGMADIATGGRVGKFLENEDGAVGFRPEQARQFLDQYLSPEQQAANQAVQQAEGFMGKLGAAVTNPSTIWQGAVESAPSMLGGGAVARGILKVAPKVGAPLAVGAGEGAFSAGSTAEQIRQQTPDGLLTGEQAAIAAGSGAATGVLGVIGTKVAQKLGIGDVDALVAGFSTSTPKMQKGVVRSMLEGAVAEGVLEELPQSVQEQVAQNLALGKPLEDGVDYAAVMGMLSGGLMGGIAAPLATGTPAGKAIRDEKLPEVGPLTKALNAATELRAQQADAGKPTLTADQVTVQAQQRLAELDQKAKGTKDEKMPGPDGKPVTIPGQPAQFLTDAERQERDFLTQNATNPEALAQAQGATISPYQRQPDAAIPGALPPETALARMEDMAKQQAQADRGAAFAAEAATRPALAAPAPAPAPVADDAALPPEPTDILNPKSNAPWKSRQQAVAAQKKTSGTVLASVAGGYVLRPLKEPTDGSVGVPAEPGLAASGGVGPADAGGSLAGDGRPADAPAGAVPEGTAAGAAPAGDAGLAAGGNDAAVIDAAASEAATSPTNDLPEPTDAQKEAGNYKKGHVRISGLDVTIENPKGSTRRSKADAPKPWEVTMPAHYGYIKGTTGADGDHVDLFIGDKGDNGRFWIINQTTPDGKTFDEHKVVTGVDSADEAVALYKASFADGFGEKVFHSVTREKGADELKARLGEFVKAKPIEPAPATAPAPVEPKLDTPAPSPAAEPQYKDAKGRPIKVGDNVRYSSGGIVRHGTIGKFAPNAEGRVVAYDTDGRVIGQPYRTEVEVIGEKKPAPKPETLRVFHGAKTKFDNYRLNERGLLFFSPSRDYAQIMAGKSGEVREETLNLRNPLRDVDLDVFEFSRDHAEFIEQSKKAGHDALISNDDEQIIVFDTSVIAPKAKAPPTPASAAEDTPQARWTRMPEADRLGVLGKAGWSVTPPSLSTQRMLRLGWDKMSDSQRQRISAAMDSSAPVAAPAAAPKPPVPQGAEDDTPAHIKNIQGWWGVGGGTTADGLVEPGRKQALAAIGINDKQLGLGRVGDLVKRHWTYLPDDVRAKLAQLRKDGWKPVEPNAKTDAPDTQAPQAPSGEAAPAAPGDAARGDGAGQGAVPGAPAAAPVQADGVSEADIQAFNESRRRISDKSFGEPTRPTPSANTIFTEDAAEKARAILKRKLGQVSSGIDPEILQAGITLAGYHIEKGARTFAAYAKAMLADLGDDVKPYLKSWYMGVKYDPRAGALAGMDTAATVEAADVDAITAEGAGTGPTVETAPAAADTSAQEPTDATAAPADEVPAERQGRPGGDAAAGDGNSEPLDAGVAGQGGQADGGGAVSSGAEGAGGSGAGGVQQRGQQAPGTPRNRRTARPDGGAAGGVAPQGGFDFDKPADPAPAPAPDDFNLEGEDIGKGGLTKKYRDNIAAIRILKAMEAEGRLATLEERRQIARYVGWGAFKGVFDPQNKTWAKEHAELRALLTDAEWAAARASTRNAHYTDPVVVKSIFSVLDRLGVKRARILEPSVGVGNFFGLMPASVKQGSNLFGVELDPLTAKIAQALYPTAKIKQSGFQDYEVPSEFFDVAIGNPPFGEEPITDMERSAYSGFSIHNYFFAKSIDKLRPGGLLTMVVSHNFLDAKDDRARKWIAERANLVSAVRLPRTAFKENAGTDVVTDIIVLQKHGDGIEKGATDWVKSGTQTNTNPKDGSEHVHSVSSYFLANPQNILGTPSAAGTMYRPGEYTVEPRTTGDLQDHLIGWELSLPEGIFTPIERDAQQLESANVSVPDGVKVGSFFVADDGSIQQRAADVMGDRKAVAWQPPNAKAAERMKGMIGLRDSLRAQMRLERSPDATPEQIEAHRRDLASAYDKFQKAHGYLNDATNRRLFLDDTEASLVQALEFDYDKGVSKAVAEREGIPERPASATKADILQRRVLFPPAENIKVNNAKDALLASLNYKGRIDIEYMAGLYDKPADAIVEELGDVVFQEPDGGLVSADEYLSGDVKTKLADAETAAQTDPRYKRNVEALRKVIPVDKKPSEIHAVMGAKFIPASVLEQFAKHVTGADLKATYIPSVARWSLNFTGGDVALNRGQWGTKDMAATEIIQATVDGRTVVVTKVQRNPDGSTTTILLERETEAAREKQNALKTEWTSWLWRDPERADNLVRIYNDTMNRLVERKFDGSHLTFPGMSPAMQLLPHQKNGVWRGLQSLQVLYDHVVGAGKTFEMATLAMEMRRLGIARKPIFAVPNHLTLQWRSEFARLYPSANVLAATPEDFSKGNREKFFSKVVTGDWDAVIVGHSSLKKISLPPETEKAVLEEQIGELADAIEQMKRDRGDRNIIRDMEGIRARLEAKMKDKLAALGKRDKVVTFDELGIDAVFVDEMHEFKNLYYQSTMDRVPGMGNPNGSDKAFDLFVKIQWLFNTFGQKAPLVTATGTPVSNSLVEMFNMQRYMQYPAMKQEGLHLFDAWARQFGAVESVYEVAPSGTGYRSSNRFAKFKNLPALMSRYLSFADVITLDDLKAQEEARGKRFPVPKVAGGRPQIVVAKRSPLVADFMGVPHLETDDDGNVRFGISLGRGESAEIVETTDDQTKEARWDVFAVIERDEGEPQRNHLGRYKTEAEAKLKVVEAALTPRIQVDPESILGKFANLRQLTKETKGKVNALSLTGAANKAGLDYRLIDPSAPDFPGSKINLAIDNAMATYEKWAADKGTQLIFCDLSVPLSERNTLASKERRLYVREDGAVTAKRGTMHTVEGVEEVPFFVVSRGTKEAKRFDVYDAVSGMRARGDFASKREAIEWASEALKAQETRDRWIAGSQRAGEITQEAIDEFNDANEVDTEETEAITRQDIAGMSGATKFSVYDDIKAKLIRRGVPEREIAFIHDYGTPTAKAKLFAAVNAGEVRFLLGSTPKMGAGTNVQKRLVGLHHIDAPWRPSDLEQREGRIIRRGNMLYERDPDGFEVAIYRYATEQTYDTRRWQLLEHKARGIEQLRNYDGTLNEIEDIDGEAANAADMKAAASGDPLILKETQLRNEVRRLENLRDSHADERQSMTRRARDFDAYADTTGPEHVKQLTMLVEQAKANPVPEDGIPAMAIGGKVPADKKEATAELSRRLALALTGGEGFKIAYRGMTFDFEPMASGSKFFTLSSPTGHLGSYERSEAVSATGMLTRLANYVERLPGMLASEKETIEKYRQDAKNLREQAAKPFMQEKELAEAREQHKRVQRALIAKGPEIPAAERPLLESALEEQKAELRESGYGNALDEFLSFQQDMNGEGPAFSRGPGAARRNADRLQSLIDVVSAQWENAPPIIVVQDLQDPKVPQEVRDEDARQRKGGATGEPEGLYYKGKVYLIASQIADARGALRVMFHETLGHHGLRNTFGRELGVILDRLAQLNPGKVRAKARQYGLDFDKQSERRQAAEEVLAEMAQENPELGFVQRAIAAIRSFLRRVVPGFQAMKFSDAEIIRDFILPARAWVEGGQETTFQRQPAPAFGREPAMARAYHGSPYRGIERFDTAKIGSGEGAQAYGWGLYFASKKEVAEHYRKTLAGATFDYADDATRERMKRLTNFDDWLWRYLSDTAEDADYDPAKMVETLNQYAERYSGSRAQVQEIAGLIGSGKLVPKRGGQLYEVEVPSDDELLLWDKPLSQQPPKVRAALESTFSEAEKRRQAAWRIPSWAIRDGETADISYADANTGGTVYTAMAGRLDSWEEASRTLRAAGIKGIKYLDGGSRNAGDGSYNYVIFDGADAPVTAAMFSRASDAIDTLRSAATAKGLSTIAADLMQSDRSFNWWHRTIGTQYQKAQADADFGRVFDAAQDYLHDTSAFANDAAALAPDVVPQLKGWRDAFKSLRLDDADQKALAGMVFEGTLTDEKVYTDDELRLQFKATDRQIKLYRQFRAAVDRSLDLLVATDVARYIGRDIPPSLKAMISDGDVGRFRGLVTAFAKQKRQEAEKALADVRKANRKTMSAMWDAQKKRLEGTKPGSRLAIEQELENEQAAIRARVKASEEAAKAEAERWADFERKTKDKYERIDELQEKGYAPLMRFGQYTVYVTGPEGEQEFFGLYESQADANRAAREFRESDAFKDSKVATGVLSQEAYKQFSGVAPETLEIFGELAGAERTPLFEQYLKLTKSNRSALKRLISRKGIAGYSEDTQRVLASFLTSNARASSGNLHLGDMTRLVAEIPKEKGDVKDEAIKLQEYVQNPTEEAQRVRGLLFVQYLGGSIASALVNMTQPFMMTFPYLSQFGGAGKAAARLGAAMKQSLTEQKGELGRALAKAEKEGIVSPQELHQLQAEASRTMGNHPGVRRLLFTWGAAFSLAEQFNRRVSFIAAWNTAKEQGIENAFEFAAKAVDETQGVYNRGNRPNWARGAVGATLFTFKQYSISYLEFLKRLPPQQRAIALMVLFLAAGAEGLPFAEDLTDLLDTIGQALGYDTNTKAWRNQVLTDAIGAEAADFALHGFSAMPGFPLDVSGRLALSNLLPGTGMLLKHKTDKSGEVFDVLGPAGGLVRDALKGEFRPLAIRNLDKGLSMYQTGEYRDTRDRRVVDVDGLDALVKGVGFQPAEVARESRKIQLTNQQVQLARVVESEIASEWAQGIADKEPDKVRSAKQRLEQWNRDNPRSRIAINSGQLQRRVRELRMTRQERFQKTIPREMRGDV